jgi:GAF domain
MSRQSLTALSLHDVGPSNRPPLFVTGNVADARPALKLPSRSPQNIPLPASDFRNLIDEVADLAKNLIDAGGSAIAFRKEHGTICLARSGEGAPPLGARVDGTSGICKACLESGAMLWCADVATADPEISRTAGIRAVAVAPIYCGKEISGILAVFSSTPRLFTQLQLQWLQQLADWIGSAQSVRVEKPIARRAVEATLPMRFLRDVFIETQLPWKRFIESVLLHAVVIGTLTGLSAFWPQVLPIARPPLRDVHITYYPSSQSFPARESSRPLPHPRRHKTSGQQLAEARRDSAPQETSVSRDALEARKITAPPVTDMPSIASRRFEKPVLATAVSPAPEIAGANSRRLGLPRGSVIAPPPELGGSSGLRSISALKTAVVPPTPEISGLDGHSAPGMRSRSGFGSGTSGDTVIVPPAPLVDGHAIVISRTAGFVPGSSVIAAPPTLGAGLRSTTSGRGITAGTGVAQVVPPPPSLTGTGDSLGGGRGDSLAGNGQGTQVVPPPPSLAGAGNSPGFGHGDSLAGNRASQIVPPPPSLTGTGNLLGGGRGTGLSGTGSGGQIVRPPPSMQDGGNIGGGRANSSLGRGTEVVPPPPSVAGMSTGNAGTGGRGGSLAGAPMTAALAPQPNPDIPRVDTATPAKASTPAPDLNLSHRVFQDVQLRVIGLAWAPPRSSYFSNFEVFIAQKVINKNETQYIKLVYVFLPYQMRLSQYGSDAMRLRRIRATRDSTCDENLMDVMWPEDEGGASSRSRNTTAPQSSKRSELLPCYITNADEYTRAVSRRR